MYRILRNTHLFAGLFCCLFLLMYGVSSVQMAHHSWFDLKPRVIATEYPVHGDNPRAVARELMDQDHVRGELTAVKLTTGGANLTIVRPGTVYQVDYAGGLAKVRTNEANFMGMLNRIHHIRGLWHDFTLVDVWGFFVGVVSVGLFVLGASGVYLWFKIYQERVVGSVLLALGLGFGLTLVVLIRAA